MNNEILNNFIEALQRAGKPKTSAYDTTATVRRIEDGIAWVHIPGGVDETPVKLTINAEAGDTVQVRVSGGTAFLVGNGTAPPTDDKTANRAVAQVAETRQAVSEVDEKADEAMQKADSAESIATATSQHFWNDTNGVHVSSDESDPEGANNILMNSLGILLRAGNKILSQFSASQVAFYDGIGNAAANIVARFGASGAQIGKSDSHHINLVNNGMTLNYGSGATYVEMLRDTVNSVNHFTFGSRKPNSTKGSDSFAAGIDVTASGDYSFANGLSSTASGGYSHAEGHETTASGSESHAEGWQCTASGNTSHAEGSECTAYGEDSHAEGRGTTATGAACHTEGVGTRAPSNAFGQTVVGTYNTPIGTAKFVVGCGTDDNNRDNAFIIGDSGNAIFYKNVLIHGTLYGENASTPIFTKDSASSGTITLTAGGSTNGQSSFSVAKTGYTPIALLGYQINGTNGSYCFASRCFLSGNNFYYYVRNTASSDASVTITAYVAYIASTAL